MSVEQFEINGSLVNGEQADNWQEIEAMARELQLGFAEVTTGWYARGETMVAYGLDSNGGPRLATSGAGSDLINWEVLEAQEDPRFGQCWVVANNEGQQAAVLIISPDGGAMIWGDSESGDYGPLQAVRIETHGGDGAVLDASRSFGGKVVNLVGQRPAVEETPRLAS